MRITDIYLLNVASFLFCLITAIDLLVSESSTFNLTMGIFCLFMAVVNIPFIVKWIKSLK